MLDLTSSWVFLQRHRQKMGMVVAAVLLFVSGWQLGRVTSPYYAAHPIIFQNAAGGATEAGSLTQLQALKAEGQATQTATVKSAVAGASSTTGTYVASVNSTLYHHKDCSAASRIKEENKVWFASPEEAEAAGYSPSACTKQK